MDAPKYSSSSRLTLRPFQEAGVEFLTGRKYAYLGDRMGLGKTLQIVSAAARVCANPILVICPAIAIPQWHWWLQNYCPASTRRICSFSSTLNAERLSGLRSRNWSQLIDDEAQALQTLASSRTNALLGGKGLIHSADRCWFASGTPAPRGDPRQLWPILFVCGVTKLSYAGFTERYCDIVEVRKNYGSRVFLEETMKGVKNAAELNLLLGDFMLRRHEKDVMPEMPPISIEQVPIEVRDIDKQIFETWFPSYCVTANDTGADAFTRLIRQGEKLLTEAIEREESGAAAFGGVMDNLVKKYEIKSLLQVHGLQKVPPIVELVKAELDAGHYRQIGLICVHKAVMHELNDALKDYGSATIYGGTPVAKRHHLVKIFRERPEKERVRILQINAAGTALDGLQCCNQVGLVEKTWIPGLNEQAIKRFHRFDSKAPVFVRDFYAANTIDARMNAALTRRNGFNDTIFEKLSVDEIVGI